MNNKIIVCLIQREIMVDISCALVASWLNTLMVPIMCMNLDLLHER